MLAINCLCDGLIIGMLFLNIMNEASRRSALIDRAYQNSRLQECNTTNEQLGGPATNCTNTSLYRFRQPVSLSGLLTVCGVLATVFAESLWLYAKRTQKADNNRKFCQSKTAREDDCDPATYCGDATVYGGGDEREWKSSARHTALIAALSCNAMLQALPLGVVADEGAMWNLFFVLALYACTFGFAFGVRTFAVYECTTMAALGPGLYSLSVLAGVMLGAIAGSVDVSLAMLTVDDGKSTATVEANDLNFSQWFATVLYSLVAGVVLYVYFIEVLPTNLNLNGSSKEYKKVCKISRVRSIGLGLRLFLFFLGFMIALSILVVFENISYNVAA